MSASETRDGRRRLGVGDLHVGPIAYGCWRFAGTSAAEAQAKIETALEAGFDLIDTADIYGVGGPGFGAAEALLGDVFRTTPTLRARMVLATKGGIQLGKPYDSSAAYLMEACEASLRRLNVDHVDLYQIHRPDLLAPFHEAADALTRLRDQGKIRKAGVSNFTASQTRALQAHLDFPLASVQPEFSAWTLDPVTDGVFDLAQETGMASLAWSPLAGGRLAAVEPPDAGDKRFQAVLGVLDRLAETYDASRSDIALAFVLKHPANVIPIIGTQSIERIRASAKALGVPLASRDWYDVVEARRSAPMP